MRLVRAKPRRLRALAPALLAAAVSACTVGPNYHAPTIRTPAAYDELGDAKSAPLSRPVPREADLAQWWTRLNDPELNWLIGRALEQNLNLRVAAARLRQAREQVIVAGAAGLPHVSSNATVARLNANSRTIDLNGFTEGGGSGGGSGGGAGGQAPIIDTPSHLNLYALAFDATWEVDIFGGVRRSVEEAKANTEADLWQKRDGEVSLTAEVANDYVTLRLLQAETAIAEAEAKDQGSNFAIIKQQAQTGFVTRLNVNQQDAQVEATIAAIPQLKAQARAQVHALGVLLALTPEALDQQLQAAAPLPDIPGELPVGLPSDLLRRRPDVRRAERQLASATAGIGVQVANLYPKFNIIAAGPTFASTTTAGLFNANNAASLGIGMVQWPLFEGGRTRANIRAARAQADQAYLSYQQTVLSALQNVEDALARYQSEQERILPLRRAVDSAQSSLAIARQQYGVGLVTFINVLQGQATLLNARNNLIQGQAQLAQDLASLFTALGGGWTDDERHAMRKPGVSWP